MPKHELSVTLPKREIGKADVVFDVKRADKAFGTLKVSKGSIEWHRARGRRGRGRARGANVSSSRTWEEFDAWMGNEDAD